MEQTTSELQQKMSTGELTSLQVTESFLERIRDLDSKVNSVIELNPDVQSIAAGLDAERASGRVRSPLHGIPILIKDNIDTHDKMQTTAGSLALEGNIAPRDAFPVKQLRKAGAVILGKTNLSEWANFRGNRSVSGWSSRGGLVVEVDGDIHDLQQEEDAGRKKVLRQMGLRIVRFRNDEVVRDATGPR